MNAGEDKFEKFNVFVNRLGEVRASYRISKIRTEAILVEVFAPSEHWEVEFLDDGTIEIERYRSNGHIYDEVALADLWTVFDDAGVDAASVLDHRRRPIKGTD